MLAYHSMKLPRVSGHILVVDDEEEFCSLLKGLLLKEGHTVSVAHDGAQAIKKHRENQADVIIMDIYMPNKEGLEAIGEIKRDNPESKIIAVTATRDESALKLARYLGAERCLYKPFENRDLFDAIQQLLTRNPEV
jgi:two-component system, chemotaxis family, chemotaxis protein CheY